MTQAALQFLWTPGLDLGTGRAEYAGTFLDLSAANRIMKGMDVNIGLIRDREGIYSGLIQSQSQNKQLAVCFARDGKLMVKIAVVKKIVNETNGITIVLGAAGDELPEKTAVPLDDIQSIYPISDFVK